MRGVRSLLLVTACTLAACAHLPVAVPPVGTFLDAADHSLSDEEVERRLKGARFVLVGEQHDSPCDHQAELQVVRLAGRVGPYALGLEMADIDAQPTLDAFVAGSLPPDHLAAALDWRKSWGFDFAWYAPLFDAARDAHAAIVGLNVPKQIVHEVRDDGLEALPLNERLRLVPRLIPPPAAELQMLRSAFEGHHGSGGMEQFVRVQSLWDSQMAWQAVRTAELLQRRVIVLAGIGHVDNGWGIASRLYVWAPGASILAVLPWRGEGRPSGADLYFYCPITPPPAPPHP